MRNGRFVEKADLGSPLDLRVRPKISPYCLKDMTNKKIMVLWETLEDGQECITVLLEERAFSLCECVEEGKQELDIEGTDIYVGVNNSETKRRKEIYLVLIEGYNQPCLFFEESVAWANSAMCQEEGNGEAKI